MSEECYLMDEDENEEAEDIEVNSVYFFSYELDIRRRSEGRIFETNLDISGVNKGVI